MIEYRTLPRGDFITFGVVYDPHLSDVTPVSRKDDYVEACFSKLDFIENDVVENGGLFVALTGDITHKNVLSTKFMCRLAAWFNRSRIPFYGIAGNHDVLWGKTAFMERTSLGILFASGLVRRLESLLWSAAPRNFRRNRLGHAARRRANTRQASRTGPAMVGTSNPRGHRRRGRLVAGALPRQTRIAASPVL